MPWKGRSIMDQRQELVMKSLKAEKPFRELCKEYGISEKTGYKWKNRFMEDGTNGLMDMSKRPKNSPTQLGEDIVIEIIKIRKAHPSWGPKKIQAIIDRNGKHPLVTGVRTMCPLCVDPAKRLLLQFPTFHNLDITVPGNRRPGFLSAGPAVIRGLYDPGCT